MMNAKKLKQKRESPERLQDVKSKVSTKNNSEQKRPASVQKSAWAGSSSAELSHEVWSPVVKDGMQSQEFKGPEFNEGFIKLRDMREQQISQ